MTRRPTPPVATNANARTLSDALHRLVRLLAQQAAREACGVSKPDPKDDPNVD